MKLYMYFKILTWISVIKKCSSISCDLAKFSNENITYNSSHKNTESFLTISDQCKEKENLKIVMRICSGQGLANCIP